jgi:hypothetical protein
MNGFGEPNMGNPSVRFDEGRESVGHWPCAFQPILSRLLYSEVEAAKERRERKEQSVRGSLPGNF